jgi:CRISPR-associated protein Csb3
MSEILESAIRIRVDPANPGQFFACCGLLEVADRLSSGVEGWFDEGSFLISTPGGGVSLIDVLTAARSVELSENRSDPSSDKQDGEGEDSGEDIKPLTIISPIQLRLDWWKDKSLKTWAGSMDARRILMAMCSAIDPNNSDPFNQGQVVFDPDTPLPDSAVQKKRPKKPKKREPFYLDARRGANARSIDVGFAADSLKLNTIAYPVVEALCLIGLQRCRPIPTSTPRVFEYSMWSIPLGACVIPAAVSGLLMPIENGTFRFENAFRTDQRKHKAFTPGTRIARS